MNLADCVRALVGYGAFIVHGKTSLPFALTHRLAFRPKRKCFARAKIWGELLWIQIGAVAYIGL